jgi:hypothetical protein
VILALLTVAGGIAVLLALGWGLVVAGLRAGDQAGDVPLVAGFSARRLLPGWFGAGMTVRVPRRTTRRKFRAGAHETVGVVPAASRTEFRLPVGTPARRYLLTAVVGQTGGRLRVFRVPVVSEGPAGAGRPARAARAGDRG